MISLPELMFGHGFALEGKLTVPAFLSCRGKGNVFWRGQKDSEFLKAAFFLDIAK